MQTSQRSALAEVTLLFLKLGTIGFGGPAAHVSLMEEEVVRRRRWIDRQGFLDLLGVTHLIPGPNSTELAIHLGYVRAGWSGLFAAGAAFIVPAMLIVLALSWAYVRFGTRHEIDWLLDGVKPVVIAIVVRAIGDLGATAVKGPRTLAAGAITLALALWGFDPLLLLVLVGAAVTAAEAGVSHGAFWLLAAKAAVPVPVAAPLSLGSLFLVFLKFGSVIFGSGYVLLAFLQSDLVVEYGWLTDRELLDAIAIGQLTPGPVFTTATFIGYLLAGVPGALVATAGIFLPSFVLVGATRPLLPRIRRSKWAGAFLDGVNVASLSLMVVVTLELASEAFDGPVTMAIGAGAMLLLWTTRMNPAWLI
ncbi:MAG: chromate efflux transporter, partial [Candidatus Binatia bacterium]